MLNFNQLRTFYHVAKRMSFTAAAHDLFITQPAVTAQIRSLEECCGLKLFKKKGRNITLTDEGTTLLEYVTKVFEFEKEIEHVIDEMKHLERGILRVGTSSTYARCFMPFMIRQYLKKYPQIRIALSEGSSMVMINGLKNLKIEVAIIAKVEDAPEIRFIPFSHEELVLIVGHGHPFSKKKEVTFEELSKEPIVVKELGSGTRDVIHDLFSSYETVPNIMMETSNTDFIKQHIARGQGISFLVRAGVEEELKKGSLIHVPISGHNLYLDVSIAYHRQNPLSPSAASFVNALKKLIPEGSTQGINVMMTKPTGS